MLFHYRKGLIILAHFAVIIFSYVGSFLLRFEFYIPQNELTAFFIGFSCLIFVKPLIFAFFGLYSGLWAYVSIDDLWRIIKANLVSSVILIAGVWLLGWYGFPRSVFIMDFVLCTSLVGGLRFVSRILKEGYHRTYDLRSKKVLIVGAGATGVMLLREYRKHPDMGRVVGFMDDDRVKLHETIHGVKVLGNRKAIPKIAERHEVDEIIIAMPEVRGDQMREVLSYCE
ncbi:MAG: hypothetical protein WC419_06990, partial [Candidatus Omnitrophota bacterium]